MRDATEKLLNKCEAEWYKCHEEFVIEKNREQRCFLAGKMKVYNEILMFILKEDADE